MRKTYTAANLPEMLDDLFLAPEYMFTQKSNYPPYNIVKQSPNNFLIEMAVAGFGDSDLSVYQDGRTLTVEGSKSDTTENTKENDNAYLYRGISNRSFKHSFALADDVDVEDVKLKDGMLNVYLHLKVPEKDRPKTFQINKE